MKRIAHLFFKAAVSGCLLASAASTFGQTSSVVYSGLLNIPIPTSFAGVYLNLDNGHTSSSEFTGWDFNPFSGGTNIATSPSFLPARIAPGNETAIIALGFGTMVNGSLTFSSGYGGSSTHMGIGAGQFQPGQEAYIGFKFTTDSNTGPTFGWMRVVFSNTGGFIKDWAYETGSNTMETGNILQAAAVGGVSLTTLSGSGNSTLGSAVTDPGGGVVSALTKNGTGTWTMAGDKTYTGATTVNTGTLTVAGKLSGTNAITVNNSGTMLLSGSGGTNTKLNTAAPITLAGGRIDLSGLTSSLSQTVGSLTLTANSILDMGTLVAGNTWKFGASNGNFLSGVQLSIYNYTGGADHLFFGTDASGLDASQLDQILFYSDNGSDFLGTAQYILNGELTPVPEPATYLTGIATALFLVRFGYRRFRSLSTTAASS